uniref:uncharacterized protein LOC120347925 n=1 Tax=Styela clava TaxID=7725 RepID=UPI0019395ACF|nr:uncharacterized protein LOC120347925 [Styela clava]
MLCVRIILYLFFLLYASGIIAGNSSEMSKKDEKVCPVNDLEKNVKVYEKPIENAIKIIKSDKTSAEIEWKAIEGATEYRIHYLEAMMADKKAYGGPILGCAEAGSTMSATINNLQKNQDYSVWIRVERDGKFLAILNGDKIPKSRP